MQKSVASFQSIDLSNWTVLITGATSGIGRATAYKFAELNTQTILVGRRLNLLEEIQKDIQENFKDCPKPEILQLDVSNIEENKDVDILVNNAGLALGVDKGQNNNLEDAQQVLQTNVMSVIALSKVFLNDMISRGRGHVVNVSSVAGHWGYTGGTVYCASKFAVTGFTDSLRFDVVDTPIRVTQISPGMVETNFSEVRFKGDTDKAKTVYKDIVVMQAEDIADQIVFACTRPTRVQIADIISYANNQPHPKFEVARVGESFGHKKQ